MCENHLFRSKEKEEKDVDEVILGKKKKSKITFPR